MNPISAPNDSSLGSQANNAFKGMHGVGEAIRGKTLKEVDKAFGTESTPEASRNQAIEEKGKIEAGKADQRLGQTHGAGVKGHSTTSTATDSKDPRVVDKDFAVAGNAGSRVDA